MLKLLFNMLGITLLLNGSVNGLKISTMFKISVYMLGSSIGLILYYLDLLSMVVIQMFFLFTRKQTT